MKQTSFLNPSCYRCKLEKDREKFGYSSKAKNNIPIICLECDATRKIIEYRQNPQKKLDENKISKEKNPKATKVTAQCRYAVRKGRINKLPCQFKGCNKPKEESQCHHEDYDQPLNVIFLCAVHHRRLDKGIISLHDLDLFGDQLIFLQNNHVRHNQRRKDNEQD